MTEYFLFCFTKVEVIVMTGSAVISTAIIPLPQIFVTINAYFMGEYTLQLWS